MRLIGKESEAGLRSKKGVRRIVLSNTSQPQPLIRVPDFVPNLEIGLETSPNPQHFITRY